MISKTKALSWTGERYLTEIRGDIELEHTHRYVLARNLAIGKDVLDIASGEGYGSALIAEKAKNVIGVDISNEAIAHAKLKYRKDNLRFLEGSCSRIPIADHSVDLVVSFETIEHHDEHDEMMLEIKRVLRPKGILLISCPDKLEYSDRPNYSNPYHVKELYKDEFQGLIKKYFKNCQIEGQKIIFGSAIFSQDCGAPIGVIRLDDPKKNLLKSIPNAPYLLAIASDSNNIVGKLDSSFLAGSDGYKDALLEEIARINQEWLAATNEIANREAQITGLTQTVGEREEQIKSSNQEIARINQEWLAARNEIQILHSDVALRGFEIQGLIQRNQSLENEVQKLEVVSMAYGSQVSQLHHSLREKDDELELAKKDANKILIGLSEMELLNIKLKNIQHELSAIISERNIKISELNSKISHAAYCLKISRESYNSVSMENERVNSEWLIAIGEIQRLDEIKDIQQENIRLITGSRSWRFTKPFRFFKKLFSEIFK